MARATSSLPVPDSPVTRVGMSAMRSCSARPDSASASWVKIDCHTAARSRAAGSVAPKILRKMWWKARRN